jgi:hypothetical protein
LFRGSWLLLGREAVPENLRQRGNLCRLIGRLFRFWRTLTKRRRVAGRRRLLCLRFRLWLSGSSITKKVWHRGSLFRLVGLLVRSGTGCPVVVRLV